MKEKFSTLLIILIFALASCNKETCSDGKQNQDESGIDCGGTCPSCPTCNDGIQNQNETGVDCGGPCSVCPSCSDGIKNQGETDIDCGGPCISCNQKYLCDGNGTNDYFPLKLNNKWSFKGSGSGDDYELTVIDTVTYNSVKYFAVNTMYEGGFDFGTFYYRKATNGDIYVLDPNAANPQEIMVTPGNPTVNQQWVDGINTRKVISINASLTTSNCSYTGLLKISDYSGSGSLVYTQYYKKGVGYVYNDNGSWGYDQLISVILN